MSHPNTVWQVALVRRTEDGATKREVWVLADSPAEAVAKVEAEREKGELVATDEDIDKMEDVGYVEIL